MFCPITDRVSTIRLVMQDCAGPSTGSVRFSLSKSAKSITFEFTSPAGSTWRIIWVCLKIGYIPKKIAIFHGDNDH